MKEIGFEGWNCSHKYFPNKYQSKAFIGNFNISISKISISLVVDEGVIISKTLKMPTTHLNVMWCDVKALKTRTYVMMWCVPSILLALGFSIPQSSTILNSSIRCVCGFVKQCFSLNNQYFPSVTFNSIQFNRFYLLISRIVVMWYSLKSNASHTFWFRDKSATSNKIGGRFCQGYTFLGYVAFIMPLVLL